MLYTQVINGILYMGFEEVINDQSILELSREIDYMLYRQGINYYAIDFNNLNIESSKFINLFQNKLVEIFLRCGSVVLCGMNNIMRKVIGNRNNLFYVNNKADIFKVLSL